MRLRPAKMVLSFAQQATAATQKKPGLYEVVAAAAEVEQRSGPADNQERPVSVHMHEFIHG